MQFRIGNFIPGRVTHIWILSAMATAVVLGLNLFLVYPRFTVRLVEDSRDEAVRVGRHMAHMVVPGRIPSDGSRISPRQREEIRMLVEDFRLWKLKLFSADGMIIFSTEPSDEGTVNTKPYFRGEVAHGRTYTKAVWRSTQTLEDQVTPRDVVETYVPLMDGTTFLGALEIYYDVTARKDALDLQILRSSILIVGISALLLGMLAVVVWRAERGAREQRLLADQLVRAERLAALGTLSGGVAHEFNNLNQIVKGSAQLAWDSAGSEAIRDDLGRILRAVDRAQAICGQLLSFSREQTRPGGLGNLTAAVGETLELVRKQFENEGIAVRTSLAPVPDSAMDDAQIKQVILNLLTNARHALRDRPVRSLAVETGSRDGLVFVRVSDSGCGIPREDLDHVFTPFFSRKGEHVSGGPQSKVSGTGLGLSISHSIVKAHSGRIDIESREDEGTSVTVWLPAATAPGKPARD